MILLFAAAKIFNQLFLENALIRKGFKIGTTEGNNVWTTSPITSFKNEGLDFLLVKEK